MSRYAELDVTSNFSFLRGGSHPEELVATAAALGLDAIAVTDRNSLAGVVRAHLAAKELRAKALPSLKGGSRTSDTKFIVGVRLDLEDAPSLLAYPQDRPAYGRLCRLLTLGQLRAEKGKCILRLADVAAQAEGLIFIALPPDDFLTSTTSSPGLTRRSSNHTGEAVECGKAETNILAFTPHPSRHATCAEPRSRKIAAESPLPQGERGSSTGAASSVPPLNGEGVAALSRDGWGEGAPSDVKPPTRRASHVDLPTRGRYERNGAATSSNPSPLVGEGGAPQSSAPGEGEKLDFESELRRLKQALASSPLYLAAHHTFRGGDRARIEALAQLAVLAGTPLVATNAVLYHSPHRRPLQDVLTCIREKCTLPEAGFRLEANAERHLKSPREMARLFKGHEEALACTIEIAHACTFSLDELKYEYPDEPVPVGKTPQSHLEDLTWKGAAWRFKDGIPPHIKETIEKELRLIARLEYARYFLTVHDIVHYARNAGILCQGRGSAANSVVCYCLAITNVNPTEIDLLFERFVSPERQEPPDIDVDFEHERREEVIQYIYARYGRDRAGIAATVISYRGRSAVREVGKALGLSEDTVAALATTIWGLSNSGLPESYVRQAGLDPSDPLLARCLELSHALIGFPRHLSQHVGGFVLTRGPLSESVPIGNGAMKDRTFIEWDKDDLDALGLLKVDVLGLGMLTCIRKAFALIKAHWGRDLALGTVPRENEAVYDMLCKADSIGVFQVESRAQMNMLPRLRPRSFYDLVIEVAIVRPGPIQGDMVHPYLRRRCGEEEVAFPSPDPEHGPEDELRQVLGKTLGVPLFQEQAMRLAMEAAKFTPAEANELRRAMATFRRRGTIDTLRDKMVGRMTERGYPADFAERCFNQIKGFGEYGFPESHAASFAHLVYVSAFLKCHYPAAFAAALLNSQPMGFYAPAQIVRCAVDHGVEAREADVNASLWDCTLEPASHPSPKKGEGGAALCAAPGEGNSPSSSPGLTGRSSNHCSPNDDDRQLLDARFRGHDKERPDPLPDPPPCRGRKKAHAAAADSIPPLDGEGVAANGRDGWGETHSAIPPPGLPTCSSSAKRGSTHQGQADLSTRGRYESAFALRLGLRQIDGLREEDVRRIVSVRDGIPADLNPHLFAPPPLSLPGLTGQSSNHCLLDKDGQGLLDARLRGHDNHKEERAYRDMRDIWRRSGVSRASIERLAAADAFRSIGLDRRQALWEVRGLPKEIPLPLFDHADAAETGREPEVMLPKMPLSEHVVNDYRTLRLSLKAHPMSFLRDRVKAARILACADLKSCRDGMRASVAGVVLVRQRPGSAQGVVFMTIEDETGIANAVIWPKVLERMRVVVMGARLIVVHGRVQRVEDIIHLVAEWLEDRSDWLRLLAEDGEDLSALANADEVKREAPGSWHPARKQQGLLPVPVAHGDHVKHPGDEDSRERVRERGHPRWHPKRHPRNERIIPKSRDFH